MWIELALEEKKRVMEEKKRLDEVKQALNNLASVAGVYRGTLQEHNTLQASLALVAGFIKAHDPDAKNEVAE